MTHSAWRLASQHKPTIIPTPYQSKDKTLLNHNFGLKSRSDTMKNTNHGPDVYF
uniref:Uncharacterized protein n=1 Tax=Pseudomonas syringae pv. actinidiae TaxID=103796 RepID=A0A650D826_PSESF|nr:hypothetical protein [Pseudomonas syringae pv. actinidiae]